MHAVVEVIPLLLHASLLLFLAGLVAFLLPVNRIIMGVAAGLLVLLVIVYCGLTILPILYLDYPYRTPVSGAPWRLFNVLRPTLRPVSVAPTVVEAVVKHDTELEPFIESLPDVLWGPNGRRGLYDDHIITLINNPDTHLMARIKRLLQSAERGLLLPEAKTRRQTTCLKALWMIAPCLTHLEPDVPSLPFYGDSPVEHYAVSARCQLRCSVFRLMDARIKGILADLNRFQTDLLCGRLPSFAGTVQSLVVRERATLSHLYLPLWFPLLSCFDDKFNDYTEPPIDIPGFQLYLVNAVASIQRFRAEASRMIPFYYFNEVSLLETPPFEFDSTHNTVQSLAAFRLSNPVSHDVALSWCITFNTIADRYVKTEYDAVRGWSESMLDSLLSLWAPDTNGNIILPDGLISCLNSKSALLQMCSLINRDSDLVYEFISAITAKLSESHEDFDKHHCLTALWYYLQVHYSHASLLDMSMWERALSAVLGSPSSPAPHSVAALLKQTVLSSVLLGWFGIPPTSKRTVLAYSAHPLLPPETAVKLPTSLTADCQAFLSQWVYEAQFVNLTEFLEICNTEELPFNAVETLKYILFQPPNPIHVNHQIRFANAIHAAALERDPAGDLIRGIIDSPLFNSYIADNDRLWMTMSKWLDTPPALQMVRDSFTVYAENYNPGFSIE
ncbi:hypothetical protein C8J57DRAFT_1603659 [Mycena rebaudengoi]|nr:hypothetical protein C8J57DRAFT_1603659 [Mycena rebaudengoi]